MNSIANIQMKFTPTDLAKYPFLKDTTTYVEKLGLDIDELTSPELESVLRRGEERLTRAVISVSIGQRSHENDVEIPSFPAAIMLAIVTQNIFIKKRYALAEAKQAFSDLQIESTERFMAVAHDFDWNLAANKDPGIPFAFSLSFVDYLRDTAHLRGAKWKLVNRPLVKGQVYLSRHEAARLLQEEIQRRIEKMLDKKDLPQLPQKIMDVAGRLNALAKQRIGEHEAAEFPTDVAQSAFPPCISALYEAATKGRHLSHIGRFTLTSFLIAVGMPTEKVSELFRASSDYNARLTRYQVEHIAGVRGSRTCYKPPSCSTLQTHGVCVNAGRGCGQTRHPLSYYRRRARA